MGGETSTRSVPRIGLWMSLADSMEKLRAKKVAQDRSSGNLDQYFRYSTFFDETLCHHDYKLLGSKIYSSSRLQHDLHHDAEDGVHSRNINLGNASSMSLKSNDSRLKLDSSTSEDDWGWYEYEETDWHGVNDLLTPKDCTDSELEPVVSSARIREVPSYMLTETLSTQKLWLQTAGLRSPQPIDKRKSFEKIWSENFEKSNVDYSKKLPKSQHTSKKNSKTLYRATSPFGSAVSKSFKCENCHEISSIMVHIPKFQIVKCGSDVHAEYLVVVGLGTVTLGVWRRFHEFKNLAMKLASSDKRQQFHNTLCSWHCLRARQRFFRCLDRDYLVLKCFLLERFLHDLVFESMSPDTVREFLGVL